MKDGEHIPRINHSVIVKNYLESKAFLINVLVLFIYDAIIVLSKVLQWSGWGGYISEAQKDQIHASSRKSCRRTFISAQYNFNDLLFDVDSQLFACSKSKSHCLHHKPRCYQCVGLVVVSRWDYALDRGHSYNVPGAVYVISDSTVITSPPTYIHIFICRHRYNKQNIEQ